MKKLTFNFKRSFWASSLGLIVFLAPLPSWAVTVQQVPNPRQVTGGWVSDMAGILSETTEAQLNQTLSQLEAANGSEMAVVTVPETAPSASPKAFATELFDDWKIGKPGQDNGVLFLVSVSDRRVEIETGYGVEAILPDAKVGNIIEREILPRFKRGDFDGGTLAGTRAMVVILAPSLKGEDSLAKSTPRSHLTPTEPTERFDLIQLLDLLGVVIFVGLPMGIALWGMTRGSEPRGGGRDGGYRGYSGHGGSFSGGYGRGSSSGGGSFGGGRSGGGGAGGSW